MSAPEASWVNCGLNASFQANWETTPWPPCCAKARGAAAIAVTAAPVVNNVRRTGSIIAGSSDQANLGCGTSRESRARSVFGHNSNRPDSPETTMMTALMVKPVM